MPNKDAKKCWEYWQCSLETRNSCPAFKSGQPCWHVASGYCGRVNKQGIKKCFTCEWFRLNHP
ncbi:MAG TPA: hypothetical protein ENH41_05925 [Candidatus Omnitrophica bacterium]|nr:hypothetical protein [Candidatus Omnitrophota bacterium]